MAGHWVHHHHPDDYKDHGGEERAARSGPFHAGKRDNRHKGVVWGVWGMTEPMSCVNLRIPLLLLDTPMSRQRSASSA